MKPFSFSSLRRDLQLSPRGTSRLLEPDTSLRRPKTSKKSLLFIFNLIYCEKNKKNKKMKNHLLTFSFLSFLLLLSLYFSVFKKKIHQYNPFSGFYSQYNLFIIHFLYFFTIHITFTCFSVLFFCRCI